MTKQQILIGSLIIALAMIGGAVYVRLQSTGETTSGSRNMVSPSKDNSPKVTPPPVTDTPAPVGESPVSRPTPTPAQ